MKDKLLILGAGGHGKVCADIATRMNKWDYIGFLDDDKKDKIIMGLDVIGTLADLHRYKEEYDFFVGIGHNKARRKVQKDVYEAKASLVVLRHPSSIIGMEVEIGIGTVIMAGVVINSCTSIGIGCIVNTGATIDHDNIIEDYAHISPGVNLAGTVKVGKGTWLGIGSAVINGIEITRDCIIGAGSVVTQNIDVIGIYYGVPAKKKD